ncbi:MAG: ComEC/Rec2 family competence protein [Armatimonadota bacterium]
MLLKRARRLFQAVKGRPLAVFCASYLAGVGAGVTFHPLSVIEGCIFMLAVAWLVWHYRLLSAGVVLLAVMGIWLGATWGIHYAQQERLLWQTLPRDEVVAATGEVITEPTLKRWNWWFILRTETLHTSHGVIRTPVQVWVSVPQSRLETVLRGEMLRLEGRFQIPMARTGTAGKSFLKYLRRQGVVRTLQPYRVQKLPQQNWLVPFSRLRKTLVRNLRHHLPTHEGHIAAAIVLNERTGMDNEIRESFRRTGTVHILSPSGTHVSMLAVAVWALCRWMNLSRRASALAVIAVVWTFAGVAAGGEPTFRASVMGTLVAGAVALQRESDLPTSLAFTGFLLVQANAGTLRDPGFQFSFVLVAAIIASSGWLSSLARAGWGQKLLAGLCLSVVCAVASAPLTALYYGQIPLIAPLANAAIALPVQVVTCGGLAIACLPWVPEVVASPVALNAWLVDRSVRLLAALPYASIDTPAPSRAFIASFYTLFFALLLLLSAHKAQQRMAITL